MQSAAPPVALFNIERDIPVVIRPPRSLTGQLKHKNTCAACLGSLYDFIDEAQRCGILD